MDGWTRSNAAQESTYLHIQIHTNTNTEWHVDVAAGHEKKMWVFKKKERKEKAE